MAADAAITEALSKTDLFGSLSKRSLNKIAASARVLHHPAGSEIAEEGEKGVGFHLITSGTASVTVHGTSRPELGPGDYFGEISLIDGKPRSATVTATSDLETISLVSWS